MSITFELDPDLHERLIRRAHAEGLPVETYLKSLIEQLVAPEHLLSPDLEKFRATLDALAEGSAQLPSLPSDSLTRQSIYQDHD